MRLALGAATLLWTVVCACESSAPPSAEIAEDWLEIRTLHFTILGDLPPERLRTWAAELTLFDSLTRKSTGATTVKSASIPVRVYVFRELRDARAYMSVGWFVGQLIPTANGHFAVLSDEGPLYSTRETLFHEYAHHVMAREHDVAYPKWYSEGMSSYLSSVRTRDDTVIIGAAPASYLETLMRSGLVSPVDLLDPSKLEHMQVDSFYASSWALVHYLNATSDSRRRLSRFVDRIIRGWKWRKAYQDSFRRPLESLEADLLAHIDHLSRGARYDFAVNLESLEMPGEWEEVSTPYERVAQELEEAVHEARTDDTHRNERIR